jgi:hypothetical protein
LWQTLADRAALTLLSLHFGAVGAFFYTIFD